MACPTCGGTFRARPQTIGVDLPSSHAPKPLVGWISLLLRGGALRMMPSVYSAGLWVGASTMIVLGGFVLLIRRWLDDSVGGTGGFVASVGGVRIAPRSRDPDADLGPDLRRGRSARAVRRGRGGCPTARGQAARGDPPGLPALLRGGRLAKFPGLVVGLCHLLHVLDRRRASGGPGSRAGSPGPRAMPPGRPARSGSSRSWAARSTRPGRPAWGPLRVWAITCRGLAGVARRADREGPGGSGPTACRQRSPGVGVAASALIKVALVQPLFREVLGHITTPTAWLRATSTRPSGLSGTACPAPLLESMRLKLLTRVETSGDSPHPPLPDRVATIPVLS